MSTGYENAETSECLRTKETAAFNYFAISTLDLHPDIYIWQIIEEIFSDRHEEKKIILDLKQLLVLRWFIDIHMRVVENL
jgi:hypothetical protein